MKEDERAELLGRIRQHPFWYHSFDLGAGEQVVGWVESTGALPARALPWHAFAFYNLPADLRGWSVLDISGWDGALAFECERRGADRVVLTNVRNVAEWDFAAEGPGSLAARRAQEAAARPWWFDDGFTSAGARLIAEWTGSRVEFVESDLDRLTQTLGEAFDLVLCCGLLYHLRDPVRALEHCRQLARRQLVVESMCRPKGPRWVPDWFRRRVAGDRPLVEYWGNRPGATWWRFSVEALAEMLRDAGFSSVTLAEHVESRCVLVGCP